MEFSAGVSGGANSCTGAKTCIAGYVDTETYAMVANTVVTFSFTASAGSDWYECASVLMDDSGNVIEAMVFRGSAGLITLTFAPVASPGNYKVRFVLGSYDRTGGGALGAILQIHYFSYAEP